MIFYSLVFTGECDRMLSMKKKSVVFVICFVIVVLAFVSVFVWKHFRGAGPAFMAAPRDIIPLIESAKSGTNETEMPLELPPGSTISLFAKGLDGPRVMVLDPSNTLLVSIPSQGRVVALPDQDGDGTADSVVTVIGGLDRPHGLAFRCKEDCLLYIAEEDQVNSYSYDSKNLKAARRGKIADLPDGGGHVTRSLLFLPKPHDDLLLISVGSSCNVCNEDDWRRAKVLVIPASGGVLRTFSSGLRNAVFLAIHPKTKQLWATEMGRDLLGDDLPPDEINILQEGRNYGWPFCYGKNVHDPDFDPDGKKTCREPESFPAHIDIPAHSAPLGLAFFPEDGWPAEFRNDLLVAYHGSWNRSVPTGYKIVRYHLDRTGTYLAVEDFITGWLRKDGRALGRPVDIMIRPDGTIFITDDKAGVVYLVRRRG